MNNTPIGPEGQEVPLGELMNFNDPSAASFAPRYDLREKAFRNYEKYIVRAYVEGSYTFDPQKERLASDKRSINARSFCIRFRDAILGFSRYSYRCDHIPVGTNLNHIKARELTNGFVRIVNLQKDESRKAGALLVSDWENVCLAATRIFELNCKDPYTLVGKEQLVYFSTDAEKLKLISLEDSHNVLTRIVEPGLICIYR